MNKVITNEDAIVSLCERLDFLSTKELHARGYTDYDIKRFNYRDEKIIDLFKTVSTKILMNVGLEAIRENDLIKAFTIVDEAAYLMFELTVPKFV